MEEEGRMREEKVRSTHTHAHTPAIIDGLNQHEQLWSINLESDPEFSAFKVRSL